MAWAYWFFRNGGVNLGAIWAPGKAVAGACKKEARVGYALKFVKRSKNII